MWSWPGAAGISVVGAALAVPADAADGDSLTVGVASGASSATGLTIGDLGASSEPALSLAKLTARRCSWTH